MGDTLAIKIEGLTKFSRALRQLDQDAPKQLRLELNNAADLLITRTKPEIPYRTGRAAASLKRRSTRTVARVGVGGNRAPYYPWLDFGGRTGINRSVDRKFFRRGRYLYPTLGKIKPEIEAILLEGLKTVAKNSGLEVT